MGNAYLEKTKTIFDHSEFGKRLKERRKKLGYRRRQEFADLLGVSPQAIGNYEMGKRIPDADILARMAHALGCSVDWLLGLSDCANPEFSSVSAATGLMDDAIEAMYDLFGDDPSSVRTIIFNDLMSSYLILDLVDEIAMGLAALEEDDPVRVRNLDVAAFVFSRRMELAFKHIISRLSEKYGQALLTQEKDDALDLEEIRGEKFGTRFYERYEAILNSSTQKNTKSKED